MAITKISPDLVDFDSALVVSPTLTIGDATAEDTKIVFDGNAQDYYIGLDDSADDLVIGLGSTVGTTPAISIDENINSTFAGTITANAGVVVDNITIDGTEIDLSSGDLTLDVAGNIILDADGGEFQFKDGGTHFARIFQSGGNFYLNVPAQDTDLIIQGNDGGSNVSALTFDMSEAGAATFNAGATFGGSGTGAGLYLNGTNSDSIAQGNFVRYGTNFLTQSNAANSDLITYAFNGSTFVNALNISPSGGVTVNSSQNSNINFIAKSGSDANALVLDGSSGALGLGAAPVYGRLDVRQTGTGAQDRCLWLDMAPASSGSNNNAMVINVGNGNMTNTVMRIHHESPAADQKLLSLDTTGSNTEKFWVDEDGDAYLAGNLSFASGSGIDFGATANSSGSLGAEVFDDYEEGTWTPVLISGGSTNPTGGGALSPSGRYTKIGNRVFVTFYVGRSWTNSPSGGIVVSGLPFTIHASTNGYYTPCVTYMVTYGNNGVPFLIPNANGTTMHLYATSSGGTWPQLTWQNHAASSAGTYVTGTLSYHA